MPTTLSGTAVTFNDNTTLTTAANLTSGTAKAWVNFDGTGGQFSGVTIYSSFNISSVSKQSHGEYTVNFTTPFQDNNYIMVSSVQGYNPFVGMVMIRAYIENGSLYNPSNSSVDIRCKYGTDDPLEAKRAMIAFFR
jgi:hypothetical protein